MVTFKVFSIFFFSMLDVCLQFVGLCYLELVYFCDLKADICVIFLLQNFPPQNVFLYVDVVAMFHNCSFVGMFGCCLKPDLLCLSTWITALVQRCSDKWQFLTLQLNLQLCLRPHASIFVLCLCADGGPCNLSGTSLLVSPTSLSVPVKIVEVCSLHMA
jgi:hypothetical protein